MTASSRRTVGRDRLMRTFLVDGFVAGTWRLEGVTLRVQPIRPLTDKELRDVVNEAERLADFIATARPTPPVQVHQPDKRPRQRSRERSSAGYR